MTKRSRFMVWIGATVAVIGGIVIASHYLNSTRQQPSAGPVEKITLATNNAYIGSGLLLIAWENKYFKESGLEVTIQPHTSGKAALDALLAGKADVASAADTPLMFAVVSGRPVLIVATIASEISDHGIIARKDRGIATPADLKGKYLGLTPKTSGHFFLDVILAHYKIAPTQLAGVKGLQPEEMAAALSAGDVDAVSTWSPYLGQSERALGGNAVRISDKDIGQYTFNLAVLPGYVNAHPETIKKLLRALERAERLVMERPAEARAVFAHASGIDRAQVDAAWGRYSLRLSLEQGLLIQLEDEARWAIKNGYVDKTSVPNFLTFIYPDAMAAVKPQAFTIIR